MVKGRVRVRGGVRVRVGVQDSVGVQRGQQLPSGAFGPRSRPPWVPGVCGCAPFEEGTLCLSMGGRLGAPSVELGGEAGQGGGGVGVMPLQWIAV